MIDMGKNVAKKKANAILSKLKKSPINYFSDLFIVVMVASWIVVMASMEVMAVYSTVVNMDNSIWTDIGTLCAVPLASGGAMWMLKNGVSHAIAGLAGKDATPDFADDEETLEDVMG